MEPSSHSWSARNPGIPVIKIRPPKRKLTEAEQESREISQNQKRRKEEKLKESLKTYLVRDKEKKQQLADEHDVTLDHIIGLVNNNTYYKSNRAPALHNAITHAKAIDVNSGEYHGDFYSNI